MKKSFTLIELLVVIAIIGILAGIIIVAANSAKKNAKDAKVKTNIAQIRTLSEEYNIDTGSYIGPTCGPGFTPNYCGTTWAGTEETKIKIVTLADDLHNLGSDLKIRANSLTPPTPPVTKYQAYATLISDTSKSFCVDYTGNTAITDSPADPNYLCN